jgi:hypothetical protein
MNREHNILEINPKSKRSRQFLKEWKQNRPWLVDTETGMVCSYCKEQKK